MLIHRTCGKERRQLFDRLQQFVDDMRVLPVLTEPVSIAQLAQAIVYLDHILRRRTFLPEEIHHDENTVNIAGSGKRTDRIAERRIVDDTAVPEITVADCRRRKCRRQAAARQHMRWLDPGLRFLFMGMIPKAD